jgi:integrase
MPRPKKDSRYIIQEFTNAATGTQSWRVTGTHLDGARVRKNFSKKSEAFQHAADLEGALVGMAEATKVQRTRLSQEQLADAEAAVTAAGDRSLAKIVSHYLSLEALAKSKGAKLDEAITFVAAHYRSEVAEITALNAITEFREGRSESSPKTQTYYESSLGLLLKADPNRQIHTFTVSDIEKILARYKNVNSRRTYRRAFSVFFNWCVRHHYCLEDPCKRLDKLPKDMTQIAVLSLDEIKRLLYAAVSYQDGAAAAPIAIGLFAGLRPSEIADLKVEDVNGDKIRVSGGKLRRKSKRSVPVPPVLAEWLKAYPFTTLPNGWRYKMNALKEATKAAKWVQDIVRHTSITFQTERDKNEALTAYNNGTSKAMMDLHYRNSIDEEKTVTEFWDLTPERLLKKRPKISLPEIKKIAWPDKVALKKLVWQKPLIHAAADIGVSDVALKKHCVNLGIELPKQGHWIKDVRDRQECP